MTVTYWTKFIGHRNKFNKRIAKNNIINNYWNNTGITQENMGSH